MAFVLFGIASFARRGCPSFAVRIDGQDHRVSLAIASRGRRYGGNHILAPKARLTEPQLIVTLFPPAGRLRTFLRLCAIAFGRARSGHWPPQITCAEIDIPQPKGASVQGDGDVVAHLPAKISVKPTPILLVSPD